MKKLLYLLFASVILACSGSKAMYKKGVELEEAGLTEEAADYYIDALRRKSTNTKAIISLKKTGQKVLDDKLAKFYQAHANNDYKASVYLFRDAEKFQKQVENVGVKIEIPGYYYDYFKEGRDVYIKDLYIGAKADLEEENFEEAEKKLKEIATLLPGYENVDELKNIAYLEPLYRKGLEFFDDENYRLAYDLFSQILKIDPTYKDTKRYAELSLEAGQYTIGILPFKNSSGLRGVHEALSSGIITSIQNQNNPFLKVIDRSNTHVILKEQELGMTGPVDQQTAAKAGELIGAKALLIGTVVSGNKSAGRLVKRVQPGYLAKRVKYKQPGTQETKYKTIYEKVNYNEFEQKNTVSLTFQYRLLSAETGEILVSDIITIEKEDHTEYVRFSGNGDALYKGKWTHMDRALKSDKVYTDYSSRNDLKQKLKEDGKIKSVDQLITELYSDISEKVAQKISVYNPDQQ